MTTSLPSVEALPVKREADVTSVSFIEEHAPLQTDSWLGVGVSTWSSRIQSAFADAKEEALRENDELRIRIRMNQQIVELNERVEKLEQAINGRVLGAQSTAH